MIKIRVSSLVSTYTAMSMFAHIFIGIHLAMVDIQWWVILLVAVDFFVTLFAGAIVAVFFDEMVEEE